jgi:endonuclease YncB( thermonuclease family)
VAVPPALVGRTAGLVRALALAAIFLATPVAAEQLHGRAHVLDGDTIVVGGIHVRLKGVAAPEVSHAGDPGEPGGEAEGVHGEVG